MDLNCGRKVPSALLRSLIGVFCVFWLWIALVSNLPIDTRGWIGYVTLILDGLYVLAVPLLGIATISMALMAVAKRSAPLANMITVILVVALLGFWAWSLSPWGQFDLRWKK
jgi:hypothetical protein